MSRPPLTDEDGEVRTLSAEDFEDALPIAEVHPGLVDAMKALRTKGGRPRIENPRRSIAFRWDPDLVARIKATGKNYNARVEKLLRDALAKGDL